MLVFLILKVLAENEHYNKFYSKLSKIIDKYPLVDLKHLGFVNNRQTF